MLRVDERLGIAADKFATRDWTIEVLRRFFCAIAMSPANYRLAYVTDIACAIVFGWLGIQASGAWHLAMISILAGALAFTFVEYGLHRWLFHSKALIWSELHGSHHDHPKRPAALPFWFSAASAPVFFWLLTQWLTATAAHFALCGFFAAYFSYGAVHHLQHSVRIKNVPTRWLRRKWIAHAVHHGRENVNFGVTTSLWDRLLGTYHDADKRPRAFGRELP